MKKRFMVFLQMIVGRIRPKIFTPSVTKTNITITEVIRRHLHRGGLLRVKKRDCQLQTK